MINNQSANNNNSANSQTDLSEDDKAQIIKSWMG